MPFNPGLIAVSVRNKRGRENRRLSTQSSLPRVRKVGRRSSIGSTSSAPVFENDPDKGRVHTGTLSRLSAPDYSKWPTKSLEDVSSLDRKNVNTEKEPDWSEFSGGFAKDSASYSEVGKAVRCGYGGVRTKISGVI